MIRGDLSNRLIHLTKGATEEESSRNFASIVREGKLRGGTGHIRGGYNCVCFSEAPLATLSQILAKPSVHGMRYAPLGVMVSKLWLFSRGGRPAVYQSEAEYETLPEDLRYRHVRYEPERDIDHTWEREWRVRTDELVLDPAEATLVVPTRAWEEKFLNDHAGNLRVAVLMFDTDMAYGIDKFKWHFVVLEDLGVEIDWPSP
jgi:hypothetical protein